MIDFHCKLTTHWQDQARQSLGDHVVPFPGSGVPPDVDRSSQFQGPVTVQKENRGRKGNLFFKSCQGRLFRSGLSKERRKECLLELPFSEGPISRSVCLSNLFFNQETTMGLPLFCKKTLWVTFSGNEFEWHLIHAALLFALMDYAC